MAMVILIPTQETEYAVWVHQHPQGFVINLAKAGGGVMTWHRAGCGHIRPDGKTRFVEGQTEKGCSLDLGVLLRWAMTRGETLNFCPECRGKWLSEQPSTDVFV
jgi:hypothetical protein